MPKGKVHIALIQHACSPDLDANLALAQKMVREAAAKGAQIVCLQELFRGQYFCQTIDVNKYNWAEPVPGPTTHVMQVLAKELGIVLIVPVFEYAMDGVYYNSAVVFDADGTNLGTYRKTHIPEGPQYIEKYYFTPGDLGYPVFKTKYGTIGVLICWDQWFPEPARILAIKGADIIFYPSAIGSEPDHPDLDTSQSWIDAVKAHGIHNNIFIAALNRVGREDATDGSGFMTFYGRSFISNYWGEILAEGDRNDNEIIMAVVDFSEIKRARDILQFHRDRRVDLYGEILKLCIRD
ncbi:MAG: carbon-nitrogen hydrolase [Bacillota bacterium]